MGSLKEVKNRINSVKSTRQITSAMKMVASAKLHKAQTRIENMLPYQQKLNEILTNFLSTDATFESPYLTEHYATVHEYHNKEWQSASLPASDYIAVEPTNGYSFVPYQWSVL